MSNAIALSPEQNAVLMLAVSRFEDETARNQVGPGKYEVDCRVRIHGTLSVGDDYESTGPIPVPMVAALLLLLEERKMPLEKVLVRLPEMLDKAHKLSETRTKAIDTAVKPICEAYKKRIKPSVPMTPCKGKVNAVLFCDVLDD